MLSFQVFQLKRRRNGSQGRKFLCNALLILGAGGAVFIVLPSLAFCSIEKEWTYVDSLYYTITSLSTVGFGDLVNSLHGYEYENGYMLKVTLNCWVWAYRGFTLLWLMSGLSFFSMMNSFFINKIKKCSNGFGGNSSNDIMQDTGEMWQLEARARKRTRRNSAPAVVMGHHKALGRTRSESAPGIVMSTLLFLIV